MKKKILAITMAAAVGVGGLGSAPAAQAQEQGINGDIWTHMSMQSSQAAGEFSSRHPQVTSALLGLFGAGMLAVLITGIVLSIEDLSSESV